MAQQLIPEHDCQDSLLDIGLFYQCELCGNRFIKDGDKGYEQL